MKLKKQLMVINCMLALSGLAEDSTASYTNSLSQAGDRTTRAQLRGAVKASGIIGMKVENNDHQKIGTAKDLILDIGSGRIVEVVLSVGGFYGINAATVAVPPMSLRLDESSKTLQLDADKEKLNAAPKIDLSPWDNRMQSNQVMEAYSYFGSQPYFANPTGSGDLRPLPRNQDGSINTISGRTLDNARNLAVATAATNGVNENGAVPQDASRLQTAGGSTSLGALQRASKLMGTTVRNSQDNKIGKVEDFVVDLSAGRVVVVIISSGGFMGLDGEYSAVPPAAFQPDETSEMLHLDATKESLANSPHFTGSQWPDLSDPGYTSGVYHAYNVEPYFAVEADNSGRNVRDRDGQNVTPLDQGNDQADINVTAQIRKAIMADHTLSMSAHNIKIITAHGRVTLRGPVNSEDEKNRIGEMASHEAQGQNVDNQLEVKLNSASNN